jgi:hypothetical protein
MHFTIKIAYMRTVYLLCTVYRKYVRRTMAKFYGQYFFIAIFKLFFRYMYCTSKTTNYVQHNKKTNNSNYLRLFKLSWFSGLFLKHYRSEPIEIKKILKKTIRYLWLIENKKRFIENMLKLHAFVCV